MSASGLIATLFGWTGAGLFGQAGGTDPGGISGVTIWVGLLVLLVIFLAIIIRAFGQKQAARQLEAEPEPAKVDDDEDIDDRRPSLKEIKASRAARVADEIKDKDALLEARQARKGASRKAIEAAEKMSSGADEQTDDEPASQDEAAPPTAAADESSSAEPAQDAVADVAEAEADGADASEAPAPAKKTLREGLQKTRSSGFVGRLKGLFKKRATLDDELVGELEEVLLTADIGLKTSMKLLESVEEQLAQNGDVGSEQVYQMLRQRTADILRGNERKLAIGAARPFVILVIGVNGVGKTTTIGKLASRFSSEGFSVLLIAGDTFRAAASDQLQIWGERTGCEVFSGAEGADPSAVVFDGIKRAQETGAEVVLVDTAGRLHTKVNLVGELKKVRRVTDKALPGAPHEVLLVLDANTGQNAINQADMFGKEIGVTGIALTKLDGTAKGGVIIGISDELGVPIQFIGIGEQVEDLREFNADEFVDAVF